MRGKDTFINKKNGSKLYVNVIEKSKELPNVIFVMTPMGKVDKFKQCYVPLGEYDCNVFAVELSGLGKSEGLMKDFSMKTITDDIDAVVNFIKDNYSGTIHLFGATGMGGILAQAYLGNSKKANEIKSFSQTGVAIHGDMSIMPGSGAYKILHKITPSIAKMAPNFTIKFKIPKFTGVKAEEETKWYTDFQKENPGALDMHIAFVNALLGIFFDSDSPIKKQVNCPTLVVIPKHDRYYYPAYVKRYYDTLQCSKEFYSMDDSHLVFTWNSQEICREVSKWVHAHSE